MTSDLLKQIKILYVEDDIEIRNIVQRGIKRRVKEILVAQNGEEGLSMFKEFEPDIVLTDIKMPKMDGLQMSKEIKKINKDIPIIIMSAHSESDFLLDAIEMGIDSYLLKPIDKDKMFEKLIHSAKDVLYEKHELEHKKLVQELIDLQPGIIFSADEESKLLFVNKTFLEFFCPKTKVEDIQGKNLTLDSFFENFCEKLILENKINAINWLEYVISHPNESIQINFKKDEKDYSFLVKQKIVEYESGKKHMVMTLTNKDWD